jgi:hypothetical protein
MSTFTDKWKSIWSDEEIKGYATANLKNWLNTWGVGIAADLDSLDMRRDQLKSEFESKDSRCHICIKDWWTEEHIHITEFKIKLLKDSDKSFVQKKEKASENASFIQKMKKAMEKSIQAAVQAFDFKITGRFKNGNRIVYNISRTDKQKNWRITGMMENYVHTSDTGVNMWLSVTPGEQFPLCRKCGKIVTGTFPEHYKKHTCNR